MEVRRVCESVAEESRKARDGLRLGELRFSERFSKLTAVLEGDLRLLEDISRLGWFVRLLESLRERVTL